MLRVGGTGPVPCSLMMIGEFPGVDEGRRGLPFVGKSGRELMRFLNGYEIPRREDVYLSNFSKQVAPSAKEKVFTEQDERELWDELHAVQPDVLVTLGHDVSQYFLGPVTLEAVHGIPHKPATLVALERFKKLPTILPCYNPAAALHSPGLQAALALDMRHLSLLLKGKLPPRAVDRKPGDYDDGLIYAAVPEAMSVDTEGFPDRPWCISWSNEPYTGHVHRNGPSADAWVAAVKRRRPRLTIHNSLHDLDVLREGFDLDLDDLDIPFDDTMVMAYLLGLEPQGLKPLAYRHAGMLQDDYADIVADAADRLSFAWVYTLHESLPDKAKKLTKRDAVALGLWPEKTPKGVKYEPVVFPQYDERTTRMAYAKGLIARMLSKPGGLYKRWADGTAREILVEETGALGMLESDPPEPTLDDVPLPRAIKYAARDADATERVRPYLRNQITVMGLDDVYETDIGVIPMINRMQHVGLRADLDHFHDLSDMLAIEERFNLEAIEAMAGRPLNPNSGDQVSALLFDDMQLHKQVLNVKFKMTKGGENAEPRISTNDKILEAISGVHPIIPLIQEGREIRKIKGTFCDPMPALVKADGRLHPRYRITRTDTGRLSAADPNVLAFPKHSKRGKLVRMGFLAGEGHELGEWDLAQIEMCVFAHDSEDERMIAEIVSGVDKHAATAAGIFGRPAKTIYEEAKAKQSPGEHQRFAAKAVNFGILMGITGHGLLDQFHKNGQLDYTLDKTEELLGEWFRMYPDAKRYIAAKHAEARRHGFVRDMWGRLRWLEGIHAEDEYIRAEAERQAQATPTQSGAQGIIKRAMRNVWPVLKGLRSAFWVEPLLQIHDAIILEYDLRARQEVDQVMMAAMTSAVTLRVPVKASNGFGQRWGEL